MSVEKSKTNPQSIFSVLLETLKTIIIKNNQNLDDFYYDFIHTLPFVYA